MTKEEETVWGLFIPYIYYIIFTIINFLHQIPAEHQKNRKYTQRVFCLFVCFRHAQLLKHQNDLDGTTLMPHKLSCFL